MTKARVPGGGDKSPIFLPGQGKAALCLHGFTGTPYEVAPLAHALGAAGFSVSAPLLAGHGQTAAALAATRWQDWLASAEAAFDSLRATAAPGPVSVAGFSMGGLLALRLARTRPGAIAALALLSVPLRLPDWRTSVLRAFARLPGFVRRSRLACLRKREGSDVTDTRVRDENPSLTEMPLAGVAELVALGDTVRREISFVTVPALVAHGERDRTVPQSASFELAGSLASATVERLWLPRSGHLLAVDVERGQVCEAVVRFFSHHGTRAPGPGTCHDGQAP
ncbi:MAG: alpha/beta fold hydrolase [Deltaproteobacteria bacterium]|nr:alpha/beta fold hydrolase [Deltaproteobacteria bacterium]